MTFSSRRLIRSQRRMSTSTSSKDSGNAFPSLCGQHIPRELTKVPRSKPFKTWSSVTSVTNIFLFSSMEIVDIFVPDVRSHTVDFQILSSKRYLVTCFKFNEVLESKRNALLCDPSRFSVVLQKQLKKSLTKDLLHPRPEDEEEAQAKKACTTSQLILHGRQMPRMLQDHNCILSCTNRCIVCWLLHSTLSAHWWTS
jgi:hypothetical protein